MRAKKELGQNFLIDEYIIKVLVECADVNKEDTVLEIGMGTGNVSKVIAQSAKKLIGAEIDPDVIPLLQSSLENEQNVEILHEDGLRLLRDALRVRAMNVNKIVASIPYQITSPLLHECVNLSLFINTVALVIQKEVAERITAKIPDTNYLATFLGAFFDVEIVKIVERECFDPIPKVDSAIVLLKHKATPLIPHSEIKGFSKFLHHGFLQQRKMLNKRFGKEILEKSNINPTRRAETLSVEEWLLLYTNFIRA